MQSRYSVVRAHTVSWRRRRATASNCCRARCSVGERFVWSATCGALVGCGFSVAAGRREPRSRRSQKVRRASGGACLVPTFRGEHAGRVVAVVTPSWRRPSTSAPNISAVEPHRSSCRRSLGAGRKVVTVACRTAFHGSRLFRGNQGSTAVGSAGPDPRRRRRGRSSNQSRHGRALALGTTVAESPRR